jgi:hypothetical protein
LFDGFLNRLGLKGSKVEAAQFSEELAEEVSLGDFPLIPRIDSCVKTHDFMISHSGGPLVKWRSLGAPEKPASLTRKLIFLTRKSNLE